MMQLPGGWCWATVEDVSEVIDYGTSAKTSHDARGVAVLRMGNITEGRLQLDDLRYLPASHDEFPKLLLAPGDVLFNRTNSPELVGKTAVYDGHPNPCSFASYLLRLRLSGYEPKLLSSYLNSRHGRSWIASVVSQQVGQANVNSTKLKALQIAVPPLSEQRRIVAKLESLQARSRRAKEALDAIPALLERFRQSVLAAAFRGDLTADWRAQHPDVEPASVLLERIRAERRRRWEASELEKMRARGKVPRDDSWKEKYEEPAPLENGPLPPLPEKWCWASIDELMPTSHPICYGVVQPGSEDVEGVRLVRVCDLVNGTVQMEQLRTISAAVDEEYARSRLAGGEVLVSIVGTIGRVAIAPPAAAGANIARAIARLSLSPFVPSAWAAAWLSAPYMQDRLNRDAREVARKTLNLGTLQRAPMPLAPLAEMSMIAERITRSIDGARQLEAVHQAIQKTNDALEPALLAKAFRGDLVPQDPSDEPASVLLERIRAEREARADSAPRRPRGRGAAA